MTDNNVEDRKHITGDDNLEDRKQITGNFPKVHIFMNAESLALAKTFLILKFMI